MSDNEVISRLEGIMGAIANDKGPKRGEAIEEATCRDGFLDNMFHSFGGFSIAMGAVKTATACATKLFPENEKYQKFARIAEGSIPIIMTGVKVKDAIYRYIDSRKAPKKRVDEERVFFSHLLDAGESGYLYRHLEYDGEDDMSPVLKWMLTMPESKSIETLAVIDEKFNLVEDFDVTGLSKYYIMYRLANEVDVVLYIEKGIFGKVSRIKIIFHDKYSYVAVNMLSCYAYIESFDYRENLITFRGPRDISVVPRQKIDHKVYQMKDYMSNEIKKSMEKGKKRCYALIGSPGTGKTTIVNKLVDELRDIPAICIPCSNGSESKGNIAWALTMSRMIAPCVVVLEDIDSLPMNYKNSEYLDLFIECLDSAKYDNAVTYLVTLNEPEMVHESLMDRRGRFDRLIMVEPPQERAEIAEVMGNIFAREFGTDMDRNLLSDEFYEMAREARLRQSDFAEIIRRVEINDMPMTPNSFTTTLKDICDSQRYVDKFKERKKAKKAIDEKCDELGEMSSGSPSFTDIRWEEVNGRCPDEPVGNDYEDEFCEGVSIEI